MGHGRGFARYDVGAAVVKLSDTPASGAALPVGGSAQAALIQNRSATESILWRDDGTDPVGADAMILGPGSALNYEVDLSRFRMVRAGGANVSVVVTYSSAV